MCNRTPYPVMARLLVCLALVAVSVMACPAPAPAATTTTAAPAARRRRSVDPVSVTIVSNKPYDVSTIDLNLEILKAVVTDYEKVEGTHYDVSNFDQQTKDQGGKFAVYYSVEDDCTRVKQFVKGAKASSSDVAYALVKCGTQPLAVI